MTASAFPGFTPEALKFFKSLERNNRREWFQHRKEKFDTLLREPMIELVGQINRALVRFAPDYVADPEKAIYRIYRDTRFSSDKTPYKTHIAAIFKRRGLDKHAGGAFYFSVSHKNIEVAGGVYMPGPEQLLAIRSHMAEHHAEFRKLVAHRKLRAQMEDLKGDSLSRPPKGFAADHPAADLIRMKQWLFYTDIDATLATTPQLLAEVTTRFRLMTPVVEFLNKPMAKSNSRLSAEELLV